MEHGKGRIVRTAETEERKRKKERTRHNALDGTLRRPSVGRRRLVEIYVKETAGDPDMKSWEIIAHNPHKLERAANALRKPD